MLNCVTYPTAVFAHSQITVNFNHCHKHFINLLHYIAAMTKLWKCN